MKGGERMKTVITQLRLNDDFNAKIKMMAAFYKISKHDYIEVAIREKIERDQELIR